MAGTIFDKTAIPFDGSDAAQLALEEIGPLLSVTGGSVHFVMVLDQYVVNQLADFAETEGLTIDQAATVSGERLVARAREQDFAATFTLIESDSVVEGVVDEAIAAGCTAIALPTHGFKVVTRWLMGNLRDKIVQSAGMPVLVLPPEG